VRLTDMRVVRSLAVPREPHGIEAVDQLRGALVMSNASGTVTVLDATVPKVRRVLEGFSGPRYAAGDPRGRFAYVSDDLAGQVIAIDVPAARVIGRVEAGEGARHMSISPDGTHVITSLGSKAPRLALVDVSRPQRPRLVRTFPADDLAHDVGFTPDGSTSGSARASTGAWRCTTRAHFARCTPCQAMPRPSTSPSTSSRSASTSRAVTAGRCAPTGWPTPSCCARAA